MRIVLRTIGTIGESYFPTGSVDRRGDETELGVQMGYSGHSTERKCQRLSKQEPTNQCPITTRV